MSDRIGLLAMAYGTASGPDDVERYYTDIRGGRPPAPEHLEELKAKYAAIGNRFPLLDITRAQAAALQAELNRNGGQRFAVYLGMKHSAPFIAEGVEHMRSDGIDRAIGLALAPHWSGMSVESYVERVEKALADVGAIGRPVFTYVRQWHDHTSFLDFLAGRVAVALEGLDVSARIGAAVVFTVGVERVYVGAHYPSDVLGGFMLASSWLCFVFAVRPLSDRLAGNRAPARVATLAGS